MRKSIQLFALVCILITVSSITFPIAAAPAPAAGVVNINTADATQLALLPRIGAKAAERIVAYRTEHGKFAKTADLMNVKGIGAKTFELLASYVTVEGETTLTTSIATPRKPRAKKPADAN